MIRDPYETLGVSHNATEEEIKVAFRKIAKTCHPDVNGGKSDLTAKFRDAAEAYEVLSNKDRKARYDAFYNSGETSQGTTTNPYEEQYYYEAQSDARATEQTIHEVLDMLKGYRNEAIKSIFIGLACIAGGLAITIGSWLYASNHGGTYVVTYGLIIMGAIAAIRSFYHAISISISIGKIKREFWESL